MLHATLYIAIFYIIIVSFRKTPRTKSEEDQRKSRRHSLPASMTPLRSKMLRTLPTTREEEPVSPRYIFILLRY